MPAVIRPVVILALAIASLACAFARAEAPRIEVGSPFPEIVLPAAEDGRPRSIADFRGRKVILHVFASW